VLPVQNVTGFILNYKRTKKEMAGIIRKLKFLSPLVPYFILNKVRRNEDKKDLEQWRKNGCPVPPPHIVKQIVIAEHQKKYGNSILVETGTFRGDMVEVQKKRFKKIISIELGDELFAKAKKRFSGDKNVFLVHGDSGKMLPEILTGINEPAIFWLDGHYSSGMSVKGDTECPIFEELDAIFNAGRFNHILLIDDARCFNGTGDYPSIEALTAYIKNKNVQFQFEVKDDIIRYVIKN